MALNATPPGGAPADEAPDGSIAAADDAARDGKVRQVELLISTLLRLGVVISLAIVLTGTIVSFVRHPEYLHSRQDLARLTNPSRADFPRTVGQMLDGLHRFEGRSIVIAGLLLLIATPVMRVAVSIFAFVYEKDRTFVAITSIVLILLLLSFFLGRVEG